MRCPVHCPPAAHSGGLVDGVVAIGQLLVWPVVGLAAVVFFLEYWWLIIPATAVLTVGTVFMLRLLHGAVVIPAATPAQRLAELERRRRKAIPVPRPALPQAMQRQFVQSWVVGVKRDERPAITGRVLPKA